MKNVCFILWKKLKGLFGQPNSFVFHCGEESFSLREWCPWWEIKWGELSLHLTCAYHTFGHSGRSMSQTSLNLHGLQESIHTAAWAACWRITYPKGRNRGCLRLVWVGDLGGTWGSLYLALLKKLLTLLQMSLFLPNFAHLHPVRAPHPPLPHTIVCVHGLCIYVLWLVSSTFFPVLPNTPSLWDLSVCSLCPCPWFYFICQFVLFIRFHI